MKFALAAVLVLLPAVASADDPLLEPYAPFKLVGVMPDTGQVLLWDENAAEYRLAKVGDDLDGWRVSGLDRRGPRLALQKEDLIDELELVRLPRPGAVITFKDARAQATRAPVVAMPDGSQMPSSPGTTTITTIPLAAPATANEMEPAPAPAAPAPAPVVVTPPTPTVIAPTVIEATPPRKAPAVLEETRSVARADFDREINDFDKLMAAVYVEPVEGGGFRIIEIEPRSWVASLGFRKGDIVRRIAGESISTVEDAARVYGRLGGLSTVTAEIERGAHRVNLRIDIQ
jgi:hypothetical protein